MTSTRLFLPASGYSHQQIGSPPTALLPARFSRAVTGAEREGAVYAVVQKGLEEP